MEDYSDYLYSNVFNGNNENMANQEKEHDRFRTDQRFLEKNNQSRALTTLARAFAEQVNTNKTNLERSTAVITVLNASNAVTAAVFNHSNRKSPIVRQTSFHLSLHLFKCSHRNGRKNVLGFVKFFWNFFSPCGRNKEL